MPLLKLYTLRTQGSYSDTYSDHYSAKEPLVLVPNKLDQAWLPREGWRRATPVFEFTGEQSEHASVWAAITAVWADRDQYTFSGLVAAMGAALTSAGYTVHS